MPRVRQESVSSELLLCGVDMRAQYFVIASDFRAIFYPYCYGHAHIYILISPPPPPCLPINHLLKNVHILVQYYIM